MYENKAPAPAGIVLAAGLSTRMGAFKQLLPLGDRTVVEVVVDQLCRRLERVVVVVGHRAAEVIEVQTSRPVQCVFNPAYQLGMPTSVQCGIRSLGPTAGYLICLGDQPRLSATLAALLSVAPNVRSRPGILIPTFQGRRGHPILIGNQYTEEIMALSPDQGLNTVTRAHPDDTLEVPVEDSEALEDLDTPEDYQRALYRAQGEGHG